MTECSAEMRRLVEALVNHERVYSADFGSTVRMEKACAETLERMQTALFAAIAEVEQRAEKAEAERDTYKAAVEELIPVKQRLASMDSLGTVPSRVIDGMYYDVGDEADDALLAQRFPATAAAVRMIQGGGGDE